MKFILTILALSQLPAHAGPRGPGSDGGGKVLVCKKGVLKKATELLDLHEGREVYGRKDIDMPGSVDEILARVEKDFVKGLAPYDVELKSYIWEVRNTMRLVPRDQIKPVDDAQELVIPRNCKPEQLANWTKEGDLIVSRDLYNRLDAKNKAAFILHEAIYKMNRIYGGATDSRHSRKVVAHVFGGYFFEPLRSGVPEGAQQCLSYDEKGVFVRDTILVYKDPKNPRITNYQFLTLNGQLLYEKSVMQVWPLRGQSPGHNCGGPKTTFCGIGGGVFDTGFERKRSTAIGYQEIGGVMRLTVEGRPLSCTPGDAVDAPLPPASRAKHRPGSGEASPEEMENGSEAPSGSTAPAP